MKTEGVDYTGDGTDNRAIALAAGFGTPTMAVTKRMSGLFGLRKPVMRMGTMAADRSKILGDPAPVLPNFVQALLVDAFEVGSDTIVNSAGGALSSCSVLDNGQGDCANFSYVGDGTGARTVGAFGFPAVLAIIIPDDTEPARWRTDQLAGNLSQRFDAAPDALGITALGTGTVTVATALNVLGVLYHVMVWSAASAFTFSYTGNATATDFPHGFTGTPAFGLIQTQDAAAGSDVCVFYLGTDRARLDSVSEAFLGSLGAVNFQVGANVAVNETGIVYSGVCLGLQTTGVSSRQRTLTGVGL